MTDAPLLHALAVETFPLACPPHLERADIDAYLQTTLSEESFRAMLHAPSHHLVIAEWGTEAAGWAMVVEGAPPPEIQQMVSGDPTLELSKFYVREVGHGRGVAAVLMEWVLNTAASLGAMSVWLGVNSQNTRAGRFYDKHGFRVVGHKTFSVGSQLERDDVREKLLVPNVAP